MGATEGTAEATADDIQQGPIGAGGLMAKFSRCVSLSFTTLSYSLFTERPTTSSWPRHWPPV